MRASEIDDGIFCQKSHFYSCPLCSPIFLEGRLYDGGFEGRVLGSCKANRFEFCLGEGLFSWSGRCLADELVGQSASKHEGSILHLQVDIVYYAPESSWWHNSIIWANWPDWCYVKLDKKYTISKHFHDIYLLFLQQRKTSSRLGCSLKLLHRRLQENGAVTWPRDRMKESSRDQHQFWNKDHLNRKIARIGGVGSTQGSLLRWPILAWLELFICPKLANSELYKISHIYI